VDLAVGAHGDLRVARHIADVQARHRADREVAFDDLGVLVAAHP